LGNGLAGHNHAQVESSPERQTKWMKMRTPVWKIVNEAREGNENTSQIVASHDFLECGFLEVGLISATIRLLLTSYHKCKRQSYILAT
jgi:hypothetical protein